MIHVVAVITAKPGKRDEILAAAGENLALVRAEEGCIEYGAVIDAEGVGKFQAPIGEDTFLVIEKWESLEHLKAHSTAPHMAAYGAKVKDLIANRKVHILSGVE